MKTLIILLSLGLSLSASAVTPENAPCKAFVFFEEAASPEPVAVTCPGKSKDMNACKKLCAAAAKKACPKGSPSFNANVNFNSSSGFEVDNVEGKCSKK